MGQTSQIQQKMFHNLAMTLRGHFEETGQLTDLTKSVSLLRDALNHLQPQPWGGSSNSI
jgi:hypothetical protein